MRENSAMAIIHLRKRDCQLLIIHPVCNTQKVSIDGDDPKARWRSWEKNYSSLIVDSINTVRDWQGLTVRQLASRLAYFGWPVDVATLNGVLGPGKKRTSISTGELLIFARALNVSPLFFMVGLPGGSQLPPGPTFEGITPDPVTLLAWMRNGHLQELSEHPDDAADPQRVGLQTSMMVATAMSDLEMYAHSLRVVLWQNAVLHAIEEEDQSKVRKAIPPYIWSGEALRSGLKSIRDVLQRREFVDTVAPPQLPEGLNFLADDIDLDELPVPLPGVGTREGFERAQDYVRRQLRSLEDGSVPSDESVEHTRRTDA